MEIPHFVRNDGGGMGEEVVVFLWRLRRHRNTTTSYLLIMRSFRAKREIPLIDTFRSMFAAYWDLKGNFSLKLTET